MKKKPLKFINGLVLFAMPLCGCSSNTKTETNLEVKVLNDGSVVRSSTPTIDVNVKNGVEKEILPAKWMEFYEDYKVNSRYENLPGYYTAGLEDTKPLSINITWSNTESDCLYYVLYLANNIGMNNPQTFFTQDANYEVKDLFAGTHYYYQVHAYYSEYTIVSRKFDFKTVDFFRTLDIDGVLNARDLGNKKTVDGTKRIKQGMVYRSANLQGVTEKGKDQAIGIYGIKTDLDLRGASEGKGVTPLGNDVQYINNGNDAFGSPYYAGGGTGGSGLDGVDYHEACKNNIKVFANANNYPVLFHCAVGRDRTGTLAVLLELLCNIKMADIELDYFVYVFSSIVNDTPLPTMKSNFVAMINWLTNYVGKDGVSSGTIYERTVEYCKDIGVTDSDIAAIRSNLLEEAK